MEIWSHTFLEIEDEGFRADRDVCGMQIPVQYATEIERFERKYLRDADTSSVCNKNRMIL